MDRDKEKTLLQRAGRMRKEMTPQERRLWYRFLSGYPIRFQRQKVIGPYIVDFYCHQARLIVEVDGSQHYDPAAQAYDAARTRYLEQKGLHVLRYANNQINREFSAVCEEIDRTVKETLGME